MKVSVLIALLVGCAGPRPISADVRPEYSAAVNIAIAEWNAALGCEALVRDDSANPAFAFVRETESNGKWAARVRPALRTIDLATDTVGPFAVRAVEHELGHFFGLTHVGEPTHLMYDGAPFEMRGPESTGLRCDDLP